MSSVNYIKNKEHLNKILHKREESLLFLRFFFITGNENTDVTTNTFRRPECMYRGIIININIFVFL